MVTGIIFLLSFFIFILFVLNQKAFNFILSKIKGTGRAFIIMVIVSAIIAASLFLGNLLPVVRFPINHTLKIQSLTDNENVKNVIYIDSIIEVNDPPDTGNRLADITKIQITDGDYSINGSEIILEEEATLTYSSFYLGCIRIILKTTPESRKIFVQFDNIEDNYLLHSIEQGQTEINLCSEYPVTQLSLKWKSILIGNYLLNIIALTSIFSLEFFLIFYSERNNHIKSI